MSIYVVKRIKSVYSSIEVFTFSELIKEIKKTKLTEEDTLEIRTFGENDMEETIRFFQTNVKYWDLVKEEHYASIFLKKVPKSFHRFSFSNQKTEFNVLKKYITTMNRFVKRLEKKYVVDMHSLVNKKENIEMEFIFHDDKDKFVMHKIIDTEGMRIICNGTRERSTDYLALNKLSSMLATELNVTKTYVERYKKGNK